VQVFTVPTVVTSEQSMHVDVPSYWKDEQFEELLFEHFPAVSAEQFTQVEIPSYL